MPLEPKAMHQGLEAYPSIEDIAESPPIGDARKKKFDKRKLTGDV